MKKGNFHHEIMPLLRVVFHEIMVFLGVIHHEIMVFLTGVYHEIMVLLRVVFQEIPFFKELEEIDTKKRKQLFYRRPRTIIF